MQDGHATHLMMFFRTIIRYLIVVAGLGKGKSTKKESPRDIAFLWSRGVVRPFNHIWHLLYIRSWGAHAFFVYSLLRMIR